MAKRKSNNYYERQTEQELVTYATNKGISMAELAARMGIKDSELFCMFRVPMTYTRKQEIKVMIDELKKEKEETTMDELNFICKANSKMSRTGTTDIMLSTCKSRGEVTGVSISLRDGISGIISSTGYAIIALHKGRLYFKESDAVYGFKIGVQQSSKNDYLQIRKMDKNVLEELTKCVGEYDLIKDEKLGLYYADLEKR